jgi:hypothetical protein
MSDSMKEALRLARTLLTCVLAMAATIFLSVYACDLVNRPSTAWAALGGLILLGFGIAWFTVGVCLYKYLKTRETKNDLQKQISNGHVGAGDPNHSGDVRLH